MSNRSVRVKRDLMLSGGVITIVACLSTCAFADGAPQPPASDASAAGSNQVQQIIVTAERRSADVQRTAIAVTAVGAKALDQSFVTSVAGLNATVPGLEVTKASGFENLVTIRGVGSETPENGLTTSPGVSLFVDGVYIANTISLDQTLFDVQDIEVLRGPQGALYGQSSIGGAININTRQPKLGAYDASGDVSFGDYALFRERAEVNVPLGDDFALRVSGQKFDHTGFTRDLAIPGFNLDDAHDGSFKAALLWKPNDNFSATLTGMVYKSDQHGDAQKNVLELVPPGSPALWSTDTRTVSQDYPGKFALTAQLYHLNLQWTFPYFTIRSVSAYQGLDHVQREDSSRSSFAILDDYDDVAAWNTHLHNYTEELDILSPSGGRLEWIGGAFLLYQSSKQFVAEFEGFGGAAPTPAQLAVPADIIQSPPGNLAYGNLSHVFRRSYSVFGQATWHVTSALRVTGGARVNVDSFSDNSRNFSAFGSSNPVNAAKNTTPTWRAEADYDLTSDNLVYASYSRGYKPGGPNGDSGQALIQPTFKVETNDAFEVGSKNYFFDHSLRLNVAGFYYEHKNFQYIESDPVPFDQGIANIPKVRDYGAEFEATYVGMDGRLNLNGALAIEKGEVEGNYKALDSTVTNSLVAGGAGVFGTPCQFFAIYDFANPADRNGCIAAVLAAATNIKSKSPPAMPNVSGSIAASYRFDAFGGSLTPRIEYIYRGREWARIFNVPGLDSVPSYGVTNLNLEFQPPNSHLRINLTATNVFDVDGINSRYTDPFGTGQTSQQYIPPRQVIGTIAYSF